MTDADRAEWYRQAMTVARRCLEVTEGQAKVTLQRQTLEGLVGLLDAQIECITWDTDCPTCARSLTEQRRADEVAERGQDGGSVRIGPPLEFRASPGSFSLEDHEDEASESAKGGG